MVLLTKIKTRLAIHARRPVSGLLEGRNTSVAAGRSLDFADLRDYVPGDDVADIDWKASARHGGLLVKRYVADRKQTVLLVVDTGRELAALAGWSSGFGPVKSDLVITVAGVIGWLAVSHGDYVGLVCGGQDGPILTRPSAREIELERMLVAVEEASRPEAPPQATHALLESVVNTVRRRTIMFVVLGDIDLDPGTEELLRRLLVQHELVVITVSDLDPTVLGRSGRAVHDVGSGRTLPAFATGSAALAAEIAAASADRHRRREEALARLGIESLQLEDPDRVVPDLLRLLDRRRRVR
jgi:uncharacterized protein (DUF58 family)